MNICYQDTEQISKKVVGKSHVYPKYGKSTTDPTFYEPSASRIANMRKASGVQLEGLYDFYSQDDVSKFNEDNFNVNMRNAFVDPRFNSKLLKEEISQVTYELGSDLQKVVDSVKSSDSQLKKQIDKEVAIAKKINSDIISDTPESTD